MRSIPISTKQVAASEGNGELDILQLLGALKRGKWTIAFWLVLMMVLGVYYAYRMVTPLYTTTATVAMHNRAEQIVDLATPLSGLGGDFYTINTEVEALASRELVGKLVDKLNLVEDPVFNAALRPRDDSWSPGKAIGAAMAWVRNMIAPPEEAAPAAAATPEEVRAAVRAGVIDAVMGSIEVSNLRASFVFYITATTIDPEASTRIANGLAEVYIEDQIAVKYQATEQATAWLNGRVAELKTELEEAENAVKAYNANADVIGPEGLEALNRQLKDRRDRVIDAKTAAEAQAARVAELEAALATGDPAVMAAVADDTTLNQVIGRLDVEGARQAFDTRYDRILERARFESAQAAGKIDALEKSVGELAAQVENQSVEILKLQQLEREAAASRQIYEYFLGRLKEIAVQQGIHRPDSRVLSWAILPRFPSQPRVRLIVVAAMMLGFVIGAILVLLREIRHTGFRSTRDLEQATGETVFAQIPRAPVTKRRRLIRYLATKPASAMAEAIRNLRTSVMLSNVDHPPQIIMTTSSLPGEGKTTQSVALAQSFAGMGRRVLLIEGDIRRRTFREYFRIGSQAGLIRAIMQEMPLDEVVHHSKELGIDVLAGEKSAVNAADFFASARVHAFLERCRAEYDIVIIDTPPVLVVPDARVIGQLADAVLYMVRWNQTTRAQVEEGLAALATVDVKVSGLVLSQIDMREARRYGGRYSELYSGYGSKYYNN